MKAGDHIREVLVPEWLEHFARKDKDYGDTDPVLDAAVKLGVRAEFANMWRKVFKLRKVFWDGGTLVGEQEREILLDLIGHCFLALADLDEQAYKEMPVRVVGAMPKTVEDLEERVFQRGTDEEHDSIGRQTANRARMISRLKDRA